MSHLGDHLPQAHILRHTAAEKDLVLADVGHRAFRHLGEHGERRFLNGKRYVLQRHPFALECGSLWNSLPSLASFSKTGPA